MASSSDKGEALLDKAAAASKRRLGGSHERQVLPGGGGGPGSGGFRPQSGEKKRPRRSHGGHHAVAQEQRLKEQREKDAASLEQWLKKEEKKKFRKVRLTKEGVDQILSVKSNPIPKFPPEFLLHDKRILDCYPVPPEQLLEYFDKADAVFHGADNHFLEMQKRVREEYEKKGYADYWVTDDEDGAPRPARRRVRSGVMKHKGGTKKLN